MPCSYVLCTNVLVRPAYSSSSTRSLVACLDGLCRRDLPLRGDRHSTLRMGIYLTTSTGVSGICIPRIRPKTKWGAGLCTPQGIFDLSFHLLPPASSRFMKSNIFICRSSQKNRSSQSWILVLVSVFHIFPIKSVSFSKFKSFCHKSG